MSFIKIRHISIKPQTKARIERNILLWCSSCCLARRDGICPCAQTWPGSHLESAGDLYPERLSVVFRGEESDFRWESALTPGRIMIFLLFTRCTYGRFQHTHKPSTKGDYFPTVLIWIEETSKKTNPLHSRDTVIVT